MELIDKAAVVAEIEKAIKEYSRAKKEHPDCEYYDGAVDALEFFRDEFLNTLEVKDDTELETMLSELPETIPDALSNQVYQMSIYHFDSQWHVDYVGELDGDSLCVFSGESLYEAVEKAWNKLKNE